MRLRQVGEFGLIERIRKATPSGPGVRLGIGDDAAWVECKKASLLITSDLLLEGVHFNLRWTSFYGLGYKTLAVNLSDLAAMGGSPAYLILSDLITSDLLLEGVHFNLRWTSFYGLGYKTLAVNLSDLAAMGGSPAYLIL